MTQALHPLERRSQMLTQRLQGRMADITQSLQAAQGRVPFHTPLSQNKALQWWSVHRYDDLGQKALAGLHPEAVFNLDATLNRYNQEKQAQGMPQEGPILEPSGGDGTPMPPSILGEVPTPGPTPDATALAASGQG